MTLEGARLLEQHSSVPLQVGYHIMSRTKQQAMIRRMITVNEASTKHFRFHQEVIQKNSFMKLLQIQLKQKLHYDKNVVNYFVVFIGMNYSYCPLYYTQT